MYSSAGIGLISNTNTSTAVTGFGTSFTTQVKAGELINANGTTYMVLSVTNDTNLITTANPATVQTQCAVHDRASGDQQLWRFEQRRSGGDQIIANGQIQTINGVPNPYFISTVNPISSLPQARRI